ncbi:transposase [Rhizobium sp. 9T]|uniref:Transposase n=1 Tax=Rhizobium croatiense TaxID=2867516 RepID=A0ABS7M3I5_9HYPH|nr:Tn3 family transposase [Rhizobium croatiense]MBY4610850.1 transposase [Rhizobium croatiense]MBY4631456.1 transposase [Rhizobium croatiense]
MKARIGAGLVQSSVILKKLAASPRQNRLNQALRERGRIERSIFICRSRWAGAAVSSLWRGRAHRRRWFLSREMYSC